MALTPSLTINTYLGGNAGAKIFGAVLPETSTVIDVTSINQVLILDDDISVDSSISGETRSIGADFIGEGITLVLTGTGSSNLSLAYAFDENVGVPGNGVFYNGVSFYVDNQSTKTIPASEFKYTLDGGSTDLVAYADKSAIAPGDLAKVYAVYDGSAGYVDVTVTKFVRRTGGGGAVAESAFKGAWAQNTDYSAGDIVTNSNNLYFAPADISGEATFTAASWTQLDETELTAGSVGTTQLADGAVTQAKLGTFSVGNNQLANNAVTNAKILNNTIASAKLAANAVTTCLLYTSPSPRDRQKSRMPSSA